MNSETELHLWPTLCVYRSLAGSTAYALPCTLVIKFLWNILDTRVLDSRDLLNAPFKDVA